MKVGINFGTCGLDIGRTIEYCQVLGIDQICMSFEVVSGYNEEGYPCLERLKDVRRQFSSAGINVSVMLPRWPSEAALLGEPAGAEELEDLCRTIDVAGKAGVNTLLLFTMLKEVDDERELEERWRRLGATYQRLVEHAEKAKIHIATHGHFTPEYMVRNATTLHRLLDLAPSDYNGITYCMGCNQLMGDNIYEAVRTFAGKVFFVHFRDVRGTWDDFEEVFPGTGDIDVRRFLLALNDINFDGVMVPEHFPHVPGEPNMEAATAFIIGYIKALLGTL